MATLTSLPNDLILNIARLLVNYDVKHLCLACKDIDDVIKGSSEFILGHSTYLSHTSKHWKFLDRCSIKTPERLPYAIRDHRLDPHVAVMFAIQHGMSEVALCRLADEERRGLDFHVLERGTSLLQVACLFLDAADLRDERTLTFVASHTDPKKERHEFSHKTQRASLEDCWLFPFHDWHPLLCAAAHKNKDASTLNWVTKWYSDRAPVRIDPFATHQLSYGSIPVICGVIFYLSLGDDDDAAVSSVKRVMSLPGAQEYGRRHSCDIMCAVIEQRRPDFMEYLVTLPFVDIGAMKTNEIHNTTPLRFAVQQFAYEATLNQKNATTMTMKGRLKRIVCSIVRASVVRQDDGSGINDYVPNERVHLIGLAVLAGDLELVRILLSHPLCNPWRMSHTRVQDSGHKWMTAKDLAEAVGRQDIAVAVEQSMRAFSERTRSRCLQMPRCKTAAEV